MLLLWVHGWFPVQALSKRNEQLEVELSRVAGRPLPPGASLSDFRHGEAHVRHAPPRQRQRRAGPGGTVAARRARPNRSVPFSRRPAGAHWRQFERGAGRVRRRQRERERLLAGNGPRRRAWERPLAGQTRVHCGGGGAESGPATLSARGAHNDKMARDNMHNSERGQNNKRKLKTCILFGLCVGDAPTHCRVVKLQPCTLYMYPLPYSVCPHPGNTLLFLTVYKKKRCSGKSATAWTP